jgi:hypothetical protein
MTDPNSTPIVQYCRDHDMVWNARTRTWKAVPADFIADIRHADFPVDLVERPCPQCRKQRHQEAVQRKG